MMSESERAELRRRMAEAAALDASDPQRVRMLREVAEAGAWAEQEWLRLTQEDERLRLDLLRVSEPAALEQRLRGLPDGAPWRAVGWELWPRRLAAAAVVALAAMSVWAVWQVGQQQHLERRFETLGLLAAEHYVHEPAIRTSDPKAVETALAGRLHYPVMLPEMGEGFQLMGAKVCDLGGHPVVCTAWVKGDRSYRVFQFCQPDYELPMRFERRVVNASGPWQQGHGREVTFWSENGCAYALVEMGDLLLGDDESRV